MFDQRACPRWASRVNSSPHAANHCVFPMYPVWTPRWTQITSIQPLCINGSDWDHMNAPSTSSDHIKTLLIIRSCASKASSVCSCGGFVLQFFNIQRPPICRLQSEQAALKKQGVVLKKERPKPFTESRTVGQCETLGAFVASLKFWSSICAHSIVSCLTGGKAQGNLATI